MRILIASEHRMLVGGVEKYLQAVIPGLLDRGHDLALLHEHPVNPGAETIDPPVGSLETWCVAQLQAQGALDSVEEWKPDVVYLHGLESASLEAALGNAYPTVLYAHNYDRTCGSGTKCHAFPNPRPCNRRLGAMCLLLHYPRRCGGWHPGITWRRFRRHTQLNSQLPDHRAILVASAHMYREFQQHGVSRDKLRLVPLPTTDSTPKATAPAPHSETGGILFVGRLTDIKGVHYLIRAIPGAAARLGRPLTLTVAGDGPERRKLEDLAHRLGVAAKFMGWVHTPQKLELMRQAELLAVPSLWPEPFGLVGIEAGSLGLPAVAYAVGGVTDWLIAGETGEPAPGDPPTVAGLTEAIVRALADRHHYGKLCLGAWKLTQRFTVESHIAQLEAILGAEPVPAGTTQFAVPRNPLRTYES